MRGGKEDRRRPSGQRAAEPTAEAGRERRRGQGGGGGDQEDERRGIGKGVRRGRVPGNTLPCNRRAGRRLRRRAC